ncbi:MAG: aspartate ammonia-lyase [Betaproteobacteria bacterium]|nr:aspartate ammonia-lyase [Betaproteobacteria bacterium]
MGTGANKQRLSTGLTGVAGEYFVAAELSRRGYIATITLKNTENLDVLASRPDGLKTVGIQVKTSQDSGKSWVLDKKAETHAKENFFYVFVNLNGAEKQPSFHVVPSALVAKFCSESHREWLAGSKRDGSARKDTDMRSFKDPSNKYLSAWHLLGLGSGNAI